MLQGIKKASLMAAMATDLAVSARTAEDQTGKQTGFANMEDYAIRAKSLVEHESDALQPTIRQSIDDTDDGYILLQLAFSWFNILTTRAIFT